MDNQLQKLHPNGSGDKATLQIWAQKPDNCWQMAECRSLPQVIQAQSPTLCSLKNEIGVENVQLLLISELTNLAEMINVGKSITPKQIVMASTMILDRHSDLRPEDVKLFTKKMICGDFGTLYDKLDVQTIMDAMAKYDNERTNQIIALREQENNLLKREEREKPINPISPERMAQLDELRKLFLNPKEKHPDFGKRPVVPPPSK